MFVRTRSLGTVLNFLVTIVTLQVFIFSTPVINDQSAVYHFLELTDSSIDNSYLQ